MTWNKNFKKLNIRSLVISGVSCVQGEMSKFKAMRAEQT